VAAGELTVGADSGQAPSRRRPRLPGRRAVLTALLAVLAVAVVYSCALREAGNVVTESDAASMALQGWAMAHGNPLLHGWRLADVSFYTIEVPEYALAGLIIGLRPDLVPVVAAATFTILVVLAAAVALGRSRGLAGAAAVGLTVVIMAGPALPVAGLLIALPDHTGTAIVPLVMALVIDWWAKDKAGRGWQAAAGVCVVLAWGLVEDALVLLIGVIPVVVVCLARAWRDRAARPELALAGGAVASLVLFALVKAAIRLLGGWELDGYGNQVIPGQALAGNVGGTLQSFLHLYSASPFGDKLGLGIALVAIHLVLAALVLIAGWIALRRMFWSGDLVAVLLAAGIVANLAAYLLLYIAPGYSQDIAPVFGMGAALAGRVLGGPLARAWRDGSLQGAWRDGGLLRGAHGGSRAAARDGLRGAWPLVAVWAAVVLAVSVPPLVKAKPAAPDNAALASWLMAHGLHSGISQYWQANSIMLDTSGAITLRQGWDYGAKGGIRPYPWEQDTSLLDPATNYANFVIAAKHSGLTVPAIEARFGSPARVYTVGTFTILVYDRNLLPGWSSLPAPWPAPISF
jgi:hypothetical protein